MNAVNNLLDKAKKRCSYASDLALAERIGVSRQQVSQWRQGKNPMSDDRVAQVAVIAKEPVEYWMVTVRAEQSEGQAAKVWSSLARRLATSAAALFVLLAANAIPGIGARDAHAKDGAAFRVAQVENAYYVNDR